MNLLECKFGVYRVFWKSGGSSVACIGGDYSNKRWIACSNWTCPNGGNPTGMLSEMVDDIEKMELIDVQSNDDQG